MSEENLRASASNSRLKNRQSTDRSFLIRCDVEDCVDRIRRFRCYPHRRSARWITFLERNDSKGALHEKDEKKRKTLRIDFEETFSRDLANAALDNVLSSPNEVSDISEALWGHYSEVRQIFRYYCRLDRGASASSMAPRRLCSSSEVFMMSQRQFIQLLTDSFCIESKGRFTVDRAAQLIASVRSVALNFRNRLHKAKVARETASRETDPSHDSSRRGSLPESTIGRERESSSPRGRAEGLSDPSRVSTAQSVLDGRRPDKFFDSNQPREQTPRALVPGTPRQGPSPFRGKQMGPMPIPEKPDPADDKRTIDLGTFLIYLVQVAAKKFERFDRPIAFKLEDLLINYVLRFAKVDDVYAIRRAMALPQVQTVMKQHKPALIKLFERYACLDRVETKMNPETKYKLNLPEFTKIFEDARLIDAKLTRKEIQDSFLASQMDVIEDVMNAEDVDEDNAQLVMGEFVEAICRCAYYRFRARPPSIRENVKADVSMSADFNLSMSLGSLGKFLEGNGDMTGSSSNLLSPTTEPNPTVTNESEPSGVIDEAELASCLDTLCVALMAIKKKEQKGGRDRNKDKDKGKDTKNVKDRDEESPDWLEAGGKSIAYVYDWSIEALNRHRILRSSVSLRASVS